MTKNVDRGLPSPQIQRIPKTQATTTTGRRNRKGREEGVPLGRGAERGNESDTSGRISETKTILYAIHAGSHLKKGCIC